jgi:fumarylacetoacetate (FAA) hydrolase
MKFVTFQHSANVPRPGLVVGDQVLDLSLAFLAEEQAAGRSTEPHELEQRYGRGMLGIIERQDSVLPVVRAWEARAKAGDLPASVNGEALLHAYGSKLLLAPIPNPPSTRDGYAFRQHVMTARRNRGLEMIPEFDEFPVFYFTNHHAVVGSGPVKVRKRHLEKLDFELEVAVVLGRGGSDWSIEDADKAIFGLCIMNDWSARVLQMDEMKLSLGPAKGKDFATGLGPVLVTLDELADVTTKTEKGLQFDLRMQCWVNGVQLSDGNVSQMNWTFAQILERASYGVDMFPGEVIGSGTVGTGCLLELNGSGITKNQWLQLGDEVVMEIDRLGRLVNTVVGGE